MSSVRREFTDSESASFLHGRTKEMSLMEGLQGHKRARRGVCSIISRFLPFLLLIVGIFLALVMLVYVKENQEVHKDNLLPSQQLFSKIPKKLVTFNPDERYNVDPFTSDELEGVWTKLNPPGKGHVRIDKPAAWKLSGGYPIDGDSGSGAEEYTVSLFHQLHCLAAIKSKLTLLGDWYHDTGEKEALAFGLNEDQMSDQHIYHCVDYLRQAIMCNGDTTLERGRVVDGKVTRGVDGWGIQHECRDFDAIYAFADAHKTRNITGIN